jgi:beta-lactamase class C
MKLTLNLFISQTLYFLLLVANVSYAADPVELKNERLKEFEQFFINTLMSDVPGAALVVLEEGNVILKHAYGVRKLGEKERVTTDTVFRLASVSKTFASAATAKVVSEYEISWDTPITSQLDFLRFKNPTYGQRITLKNILSQSTGLVPHAYTNLIEDNVSYDRILGRLNKVDFVCSPGECYSYQNVVYSLVGDLVELKTSKSYEDYVSEALFKPLDMNNASFGLNAFINSENHATPHIKQKKRWTPVKRVSRNYYSISPAAGINASINDLTKWLQAQMGQRTDVLAHDMLDQLHSRITKTSKYQAHYGRRDNLGDAYYGLGWRVFDYAQQEGFVHHGGWVQGMRAEMVFNRELQIGMAFLTNAEANDLGDVLFKFLEIYVPDEHTEDALKTTLQISRAH